MCETMCKNIKNILIFHFSAAATPRRLTLQAAAHRPDVTTTTKCANKHTRAFPGPAL